VDGEIHLPREGRVNLRTGDGSIRFSNFRGNMDLQSSDGDQDIDSVDGSLRAAHPSDGHIKAAGRKAAGRFDSLQLSSSDSQLEVRALAGSTISSNWDLHAGDGADVDLHTDDGYISLVAGTCSAFVRETARSGWRSRSRELRIRTEGQRLCRFGIQTLMPRRHPDYEVSS
jgi:hypothetical protein